MLARGPEASADLITVLAIQVVTLTAGTAPNGAADAAFTASIRSHVEQVRHQQREERRVPAGE
ncbi:hypothetical protein ABZZ17_19440 [Streptomyces sp. NPDC006512]|uniref:hypothetical protein n=1 Tax=Streptomyces sp. NPDC006512 TaxID=3154307 RepID=UPI0033A20A5F